MHALAICPDNSAIFQTSGRLVGIRDAEFFVETDDGRFTAARATSCLIEPELDDLVLLSGPQSGKLYILAVLEREGSSDARITADGDLSLHLGDGKFSVSASDGMNLVSPEKVSIVADRLETHAREGTFFVSSVRVVSKVVDSVLDRLSQRIKESFRRVEGMDHMRSGQVDYEAKGMMRLHGENTLMSARQLVKADGKQIHIG